jgi:hypothetical protein
MTAPVLQMEAEAENEWTVSFVLPGGKSMAEYPHPDDATVVLRQLPERLVLAATWSGRWSYASVERQAAALKNMMNRQGLSESGPVVWARYDPPWKPWFLRRNEDMKKHLGSEHSSLQSIKSGQSMLSAYSRNSFLSIGSYGSFLSIGSVGSAFSIGSIGSFASAFSILSGASKFAVMAWRNNRG